MINKHFDITESIVSFFMQERAINNHSKIDMRIKRDPIESGKYKKVLKQPMGIKPMCVGHFESFSNNCNLHLGLFPLFFDYLDSYIDTKFNTVGMNFKKKIEIINQSSNDIFIKNLYGFCVPIRNKLIHHIISYEDKQLIYGNDKKQIALKSFKILNEIIYQYLLPNTQSLYEKNSLYSALYFLLEPNNEFRQKIDQECSFILISPQRFDNYEISEVDNIKGTIFYYISQRDPTINVAQCVDDRFLKKHVQDGYYLYSGYCYLIKLDNERQYLIPSELIIKNPKLTFDDIEDWRYPIVCTSLITNGN